MNCSKNHLKSLLSSTLSCLSSSTIQEKCNTPKQKGGTCLRNLQHSPKRQNRRKEEQICFNIFAAFSTIIKTQKRRTSDWKNWLYYIKWQEQKIRTHAACKNWLHFNIWKPYQHSNKCRKHKKELPAILLNGKSTKKNSLL